MNKLSLCMLIALLSTSSAFAMKNPGDGDRKINSYVFLSPFVMSLIQKISRDFTIWWEQNKKHQSSSFASQSSEIENQPIELEENELPGSITIRIAGREHDRLQVELREGETRYSAERPQPNIQGLHVGPLYLCEEELAQRLNFMYNFSALDEDGLPALMQIPSPYFLVHQTQNVPGFNRLIIGDGIIDAESYVTYVSQGQMVISRPEQRRHRLQYHNTIHDTLTHAIFATLLDEVPQEFVASRERIRLDFNRQTRERYPNDQNVDRLLKLILEFNVSHFDTAHGTLSNSVAWSLHSGHPGYLEDLFRFLIGYPLAVHEHEGSFWGLIRFELNERTLLGTITSRQSFINTMLVALGVIHTDQQDERYGSVHNQLVAQAEILRREPWFEITSALIRNEVLNYEPDERNVVSLNLEEIDFLEDIRMRRNLLNNRLAQNS